MEKFLREYLEMVLEANEIEIEKEEKENIIEELENDDELWDVLDGKIFDLLN